MEWSQLSIGAMRIWHDDQIAIVITVVLIAVQVALLVYVGWNTRRPLNAAKRQVESLAAVLKHSHARAHAMLTQDGSPRLIHSWNALFDRDGVGSSVDALEPGEAFEPTRLLPPKYNPRLDSAAPGLFTALGIVGTFVGLIFGFLRVNPAEASTSVGPLLGGMVVAFINSLLGVVLSIIWTASSRAWRHKFDVACQNLAVAASKYFTRVGAGDQLISHLEALATGQEKLRSNLVAISEGILQLKSSNEAASKQLLENLSAKVGESFASIVNMPFEQLNESVVRFDEVVKLTAARQEEIKKRLDAAAERLSEAEIRLSATFNLARECVEEFSLAALQLKEGSEAAGSIVASTQAAATGIGGAASEVNQAAARFHDISLAITSAVNGLGDGTRAMAITASRFEKSSAQIEQAVATLREVSDDAAEQSVAAVRNELEGAIRVLVDRIRESGVETIAAYQQSSEQVVTAVDGRMSDLTDRLSAELTTLASRLPAEVESLNQSMSQIRIQIQRATRSMEDSAAQLAQRTPEALRNQLDAYDHALAKAMDHFNGTLQQWDGKLTALERFSLDLRTLALRSDQPVIALSGDGLGHETAPA